MTQWNVTFEPSKAAGTIKEGESVLQAALRAHVNVGQQCAGAEICGKCKVFLGHGDVNPFTPIEIEKLDKNERSKGIRLACQLYPRSNCTVTVLRQGPEDYSDQPFSLIGAFSIEEKYRACKLSLPPPSLTDCRDDAERLKNAVVSQCGIPAPSVDSFLYHSLPRTLRTSNWKVVAVLRDNEIVSLRDEQDGVAPFLGLAVDLGSTKIAAYLVDLQTGKILTAAGIENPQLKYGADIITRLTFAIQSENNARTLRVELVEAVNELVMRVCKAVGLKPDSIFETVFVGNTAIHHLFLGLPVEQLIESPFVPVCTEPLTVKTRTLEFEFAPGAYSFILPNIAGFVGADHVGMLLAAEKVINENKTTLLMDVGTNTEICLVRDGHMTSVSTPSGPAFEGGHIRKGMQAVPGAIEAVSIKGDSVDYSVIGGVDAMGICGSGVIDLISELYREGIIDWRGRLKEHPRVDQTEKYFELCENVTITQKDILEFMLAKGAISAGFHALLSRNGLEENDLDAVVIAGAFGSHINIEKAILVGLFPDIAMEKFSQIGNAAGAGAITALLSESAKRRATELQHQIEYIELADDSYFKKNFHMRCYFPKRSDK